MSVATKDKHEETTRGLYDPEFLPAALFFATSAFLPQGVRVRDRVRLVSGLVEEHSPLPLDQTAWGFLTHVKNRRGGRLFYYAAPRDLVKEHSEGGKSRVLLPSFAVLSGLRFNETTWLFYKDAHCLSAIRFPKGEAIPDKVVARFLHDSSDPVAPEWNLRQVLEDSVVKPDVAGRDSEVVNILPGIITSKCEVVAKGKRLRFHLFQATEQGQSESSLKHNELKAADFVLAADLRDFSEMAQKQQGADTEKRILIGMVATVVAILALAGWEFRHWQKSSDADRLQAQIRERTSRVERLQEIESMQQAVETLFRRNFEPLDWLMAVNQLRPPEIAFTTFSFEEGAHISISGQAGEITVINDFADAVRNDSRFTSATLSQVQTTREGATFNLRIEPGDRDAQPSPLEEATVAGEDVETAALSSDSTQKQNAERKRPKAKVVQLP
jgi:Tfp pilus assembly protein PilN